MAEIKMFVSMTIFCNSIVSTIRNTDLVGNP
jgi:hypothetical protein